MRLPLQRRPAPRLEELERRLAPATLVVTNVNDIGPGSLRQAILSSDATGPGPNVIDFAVPGPGVHTISPGSPLPSLTVPAVIDGTSQPGFAQANAPQIVLDGTSAGPVANGLVLAANGCAVLGLAVDDFAAPGTGAVLVQSSNDLIAADYLGADATGTRAVGNFDGVFILGPSANDVVQNNVISGNALDGVIIQASAQGGATGVVVANNLIGTDVTGTTALPNAGTGVDIISSSGTRVGGNVISGNRLAGLALANSPATGNVVANNLIGTDITGTRPVGNRFGVVFASATPRNTLQANVISGNVSDGVLMQPGSGNVGNLLMGNVVGLDLGGERPLGNGGVGIDLQGSTNGIVAGNTVAFNAAGGIALNAGGTNTFVTGNVLLGNRVGTDAGGTVAAGNGGRAGVEIFGQAQKNVLDSNLIDANLTDGVYVHDSGTSGNALRRNLIGLTAAGAPLPNALHGVEIANVARGNTLFGNAVLFNGGHGVVLHDIGTSGNVLTGNNLSFNVGAGLLDIAGAADNTVGGTTPGAGNTVAVNGQAGVWVDGPLSGVLIEANAIFSNAGLGGIALTHGGNANPPIPALLYALSTATGTVVVGTLHGAANSAYRLEFFDNPSGGGQGQTFLDSLTVHTDGNGDVSFSEDLAGALTSLTATTIFFSSTSAFSAAVAVARL
jgi:titin